jgi:iron complex outermembrane receptor protein
MPRRLAYFIFFGLLLNGMHCFGQQPSGKVVSRENSIEIRGVEVIDDSGHVVDSTDERGFFSIASPGNYHFQKEGYHAQGGKLDPLEFTVISLEEKPQNLDEVLIKTDNFQAELRKISSSISLLSPVEIRSNDQVNIAPVLNMTPGVYMNNGTWTTNRITIRGIGSRNLFGTSKIRAYYQDIPLTNGSGETTIEDIEIGALGRLEILKGPSSSLYGAGLGGTIQLIPDKGLFDKYQVSAETQFGSFGLQRYLVSANLGNKRNSVLLNYSDTQRDGFRENNETRRRTLTFSSNHYLTENDRIVAIGNLIDLRAEIPSSISEEDYLNNPEKAAFTWGRAEGFEDYTKILAGLSWNHDYRGHASQITSLFGSLLDSYEARPFNILEENTRGIGIRSRFLNRDTVFERKLQWTAGVEVFYDHNDYETYENLYQDYPPGTGSVKGSLLSDLTEKRFYLNVFADSKYHLSDKVILDLGFNVNRTQYDLVDDFQNNSTDISGDYSFQTMFSPRIGLSYQLNSRSMAYAQVSHGFSPPKLEETLMPDGLINTDIQPETGWNYEIGSRGRIIREIFQYELSLYLMDVRNLLVARRTGDDQFIGVNAGQTELKGLEIGLSYFLISSEAISISHSNALSLNYHIFKEFEDLDQEFSGNDLTGVPSHTFNSQLYIRSRPGIFGYINYYAVGEIPVRDDNSVYSDAYQVVNLKVGYQAGFHSHWQLELYGGVNNLFDEKYASMLQINAGSFGGSAPRYYYPGEPVNFYAGLKLGYAF